MVNGDRKNTNQADIQVIADPSIGENFNSCVDLPIMIINKIPISQPFIRIGTIVQIKTNNRFCGILSSNPYESAATI